MKNQQNRFLGFVYTIHMYFVNVNILTLCIMCEHEHSCVYSYVEINKTLFGLGRKHSTRVGCLSTLTWCAPRAGKRRTRRRRWWWGSSTTAWSMGSAWCRSAGSVPRQPWERAPEWPASSPPFGEDHTAKRDTNETLLRVEEGRERRAGCVVSLRFIPPTRVNILASMNTWVRNTSTTSRGVPR